MSFNFKKFNKSLFFVPLWDNHLINLVNLNISKLVNFPNVHGMVCPKIYGDSVVHKKIQIWEDLLINFILSR